MGLLAAGTPLCWDEARRYSEHIRTEGIEQLLYVFQKAGKRDNDPLYWGDELEYMMVEVDNGNSNAMVDVVHDYVLTELNTDPSSKLLCKEHNVEFHPEYGRYMIEATPGVPYHGLADESYVEYNMAQRRKIADYKLSKFNSAEKHTRYVVLSLTSFPRLGTDNFINIPNPWNHKNSASRSLFLPDEIINRHVRFPTLTANIRTRRGEKVCINIPMYKDEKTPKHDTSIYPRDWFVPEDMEAAEVSKPGHIYMDAMGFGMGSSCLQMTYQAPNIEKARFLYDSLVNFAPVLLSLSAAAPVFKGWLADQDVRWNVISGAVDCRTPWERSEEPALPQYNIAGCGGVAPRDRKHLQRIPKSRYSAVDLFLGGHNKFFNRTYNDANVPVNTTVLKRLLENDIAPLDYDLAKHFAHLFIRDSVSIFEESINQDRETSTNHFENLQSTNWQTLRFKPPTQKAVPSNKKAPGWRVEFRPLEVQLTDFENAAFATFLYLVVDAVLTFSDNLNPYLMMSKVWENMHIAHNRDSVRGDKFHWKKKFNTESPDTSLCSIDEIFHSASNGIFSNFINPILSYRNLIDKDWQELKTSVTHKRLYYYLALISKRASGELPSTARYMRHFILNHSDYKQDSRVSELINYDLILLAERITNLDNSNDEITGFFGQEISEYLLQNRL
ncbi:glutamate--cysteine ligase KNAG_0C01510 [Huiozyma naganishii CBS 8797]|uniref:Glutamate--cysteine ligase n=1 Tax=Huiozyma naganishii (strain ATCC MYA-139 / BCRC 22969 / CBS 8797 / KCTC 17520 / NBRC 10181 / NCYC 3082 / Yp74L-3) TaxID=1071383 RepID=J7S4F1_HUIN7|nr:hypothetical protein KNAG_0C01510 [Kazachstania naganishii CBS 8797]CCK69264.1 hypothetical protein KNAG_0C01510 [Kazachstania naganishii CBS 8797]